MKIFSVVALAVVATSPLTAQTPSHRYNFQNSFADAYGGPSLAPDGGTLSGSGYAFGPNQGLRLSGGFADSTNYTIVIRSLFTGSTYNGWRKIVDFKDRSTDLGFYSSPSNASTLYNIGSGGSGAYNTSGVQQLTVITRDKATNLFAAYIDGVQQFTVNDASGYGIFSTQFGLARFFEDDFSGINGEASNGAVDYIAIYDDALSASQVADLTVITATVTPEPASLLLFGTGLLAIGGLVRKRNTV